MGVPRGRKTKSATHTKRSHQALRRANPARCKNCRAPVRPHEVCQNCGFYRDRQAINVASKK